MVVPKKTPRDIVARMHQETVNGLGDPAVKEKLAKLGVEEMIMKPEDFDARIAREAPVAVALPRPSAFHRSDGRGMAGRTAAAHPRGRLFFRDGLLAQPAPGRENGARHSAMFEGFTRTEIRTSGARIVTVHGGHGPPLLLMHGNPFSHVSWHKVAPRLANEFTWWLRICAATENRKSRPEARIIAATRSAPWRRTRWRRGRPLRSGPAPWRGTSSRYDPCRRAAFLNLRSRADP